MAGWSSRCFFAPSQFWCFLFTTRGARDNSGKTGWKYLADKLGRVGATGPSQSLQATESTTKSSPERLASPFFEREEIPSGRPDGQYPERGNQWKASSVSLVKLEKMLKASIGLSIAFRLKARSASMISSARPSVSSGPCTR